jgi:CRP/FNR family cyclic AMP-dependent transcriptional regulator
LTVDVTPFRGLTLFTGVTDDQLSRIAARLRRRIVPAGTPILTEGERDTSLFLLSRGSVVTTKRLGLVVRSELDADKQKLLVRFSAPQFFGELGLLSDLERSATVTADGECELLELARADFERLVQEDLQLAFQLIRNIAVVIGERLRNADRDILKLTAALSLSLGNR